MSTPVDAVPAPVRALADLFTEQLAAVAFPDIDAAGLTAALAKVDGLQADVARLEEELAKAKATFDTGRDDLVRLCARAQAYARVYAEDDEALRNRIDAINLPRTRQRPTLVAVTPAANAVEGTAPAPAPAKKRGKRATDEASQLFEEQTPASERATDATSGVPTAVVDAKVVSLDSVSSVA